MSPPAELGWHAKVAETKADSVEEVLRLVRQVDAEHQGKDAIGMHIRREDGEEMIAVLGAERVLLDWFPAGYDGMGSYHTVAESFDPDVDELSQKPEVITYFLFGHHGEVPLEYTVAKNDAFEAIRQFVMSTGRPSVVRWDLD